MATLKTNYKDDILDTSANTQRKYRIVNNADGTISLEDVTVYTQNGDSFGAADINKTNQAVLDLNSSLEWINKPYTQIYSSNTINENGTKINMDLSQYNEFMLAVEYYGSKNTMLYASTVMPKSFNDKLFRTMIDDTRFAQMKLDTDGFMVWRIMPSEKYYISVYAR